MKLLVATLPGEFSVERLVPLFDETTARKITVVDSENLGTFISERAPERADHGRSVGTDPGAGKTVTAILDDERDFPRIKDRFAAEGIEFGKPGSGMLITVPIDHSA